MARVDWDNPYARVASYGVDRGMVYSKVIGESSKGSPLGVPWVGLIDVKEKMDRPPVNKHYQEGVKYAQYVNPGDLKASISCFSYPGHFTTILGGREGVLSIDGALSSYEFSIAYRTKYTTAADPSKEQYKIHVIYNLTIADYSATRATVTDDVDLTKFSFEVEGRPERILDTEFYTTKLTFDSAYMSAIQFESLEQVLFGSSTTDPCLPDYLSLAGLLYATSESLMGPEEVLLTNYVPNSQLVGSGTMVEVRRNYHFNPGARNTASSFGWSSYSGTGGNVAIERPSVDAAWSASGKAFEKEWTAVPNPGSGDAGCLVGAYTKANPGEVFTVEFTIGIEGASAWVGSPNTHDSVAGAITTIASSTATGILQPGQQRRVWATFTVTGDASDGARVICSITNKSVGTRIQLSEANIYPGEYRDVGYWDGLTTSPDSDLTARFTGTANASPSVLEGREVSGTSASTPTRSVFRSTLHGDPAIRVITKTLGGRSEVRLCTGNIGATNLVIYGKARRHQSVPGRGYTFLGDEGSPWASSLMIPAASTGTQDGSGSYTNNTTITRIVGILSTKIGESQWWSRPYIGIDPDGDWFPVSGQVEYVQDSYAYGTRFTGAINNSPAIKYRRPVVIPQL